MEQIITEQVVIGMRPARAVNEKTVGNQTYISPLAEKVMVALENLRSYVADEVCDAGDSDGFSVCRSRILDADLYEWKSGGERVFESRTGPVFKGARKLYLNALAKELVEIREQFESGERAKKVTPLELTWLCQSTISDVLIGPEVKVVFDSRLAYAEPNFASQIDRAERRYHGIKRD